MAGTLYLRFATDTQAPVSWLVHGADRFHAVEHGTLEEAAAQASGLRVSVLVPSSEVLLTHVQLPTQQRQRLLRAVPFALEEQVAADVERQHFALGPAVPGKGIAVAVTARERMDGWLEQLAEVGLHPHTLVPDSLALPFNEAEWTLLIEPHGALLRTAPTIGHALDLESVALMLPLALEQAGDGAPQRLRVIYCDGAEPAPDVRQMLSGLSLELNAEACAGGALKLLSAGVGAPPPLNLLQGSYSRREQLGKLWRPWRGAAALLAALLVLQGGMAAHGYWQQSREAEALSQQIEQAYRRAFPDTRNLVNPKVQMERQLAALKGGAMAGGFASLLSRAAPVWAETSGLSLRALRYKDASLEIDLTLGDFQALDKLNQKLTQSGLVVSIESANAGSGKVEGRLKMVEAAR